MFRMLTRFHANRHSHLSIPPGQQKIIYRKIQFHICSIASYTPALLHLRTANCPYLLGTTRNNRRSGQISFSSFIFLSLYPCVHRLRNLIIQRKKGKNDSDPNCPQLKSVVEPRRYCWHRQRLSGNELQVATTKIRKEFRPTPAEEAAESQEASEIRGLP